MTEYGKLFISVFLVLALLALPSSALEECTCSPLDPDHDNLSALPEALTCYVMCKSLGDDEFSDTEGYGSNETLPEDEPAPCSLPPVASESNLTVYENTSVEITLLATDPDGDAITYMISSGPGYGILGSVTGNTVVYTPDPTYTGTDSFSFRAHDGLMYSGNTTVTITIEPDCSSRPPHIFYGTVTMNGEPAPENILITATGPGVFSNFTGNPLATRANGSYGSEDNSVQDLVVKGCIENGTPIVFSVNGMPAEVYEVNTSGPWQAAYPFRSGGVTNLNLRTPAVPPPPDTVYINALEVTITNTTYGFSQTVKLDKNPWMELRVTGGMFTVEISATGYHQFRDGPVFGRYAILGIYEQGSPVSKEIKVPFGSRKVRYEYIPTETRTLDILIYVNDSPEIRDVKHVTIHVVSGPVLYPITATAGKGGSISPTGQVMVREGDTRGFDVYPSYGYEIADVIVDGQSQGAITTYTFANVHSDHQIHAIFGELPRYTITATADAGGTISPLGQVPVVRSAAQRFEITASDGYEIADVLVDGQSKGVITSYTFSRVHADHQITALFAENHPAS